MAAALASSNSKSFWHQVHRVNKSNKPTPASSVDGVSDHLIHALPAICSSLASLFTAILRHGYMPKPIRGCTIVPIPKGNKDPALAPTLSKALEWCILLSYPDHFLTSGLQFGFKQKMSTSLCTGTIKNIVSRYLHENSAVFACFLDASKAFDLVNHKILFERLFDRKLPAYLIRFFFIMVQGAAHVCKMGELFL